MRGTSELTQSITAATSGSAWLVSSSWLAVRLSQEGKDRLRSFRLPLCLPVPMWWPPHTPRVAFSKPSGLRVGRMWRSSSDTILATRSSPALLISRRYLAERREGGWEDPLGGGGREGLGGWKGRAERVVGRG